MSIREQIAAWIWSKLKSKSASEFKEMQEYYQSRIEFVKRDYEERIAYIEKEKKKHPENGTELVEHLKTIEFYYHMTLKLNDENRDLKEEMIFLRKEYELFKNKHG